MSARVQDSADCQTALKIVTATKRKAESTVLVVNDVPDSLEFAFGLLSRETLCEGARLEQQVVPARLRCDACDHEWEITVPAFRCEQCGTADVEVLTGEELEVESIEVSEEEAACIA